MRIGPASLAGSSAGAFFAAGTSTEVLKPVITVVLLGVADLGIGFYDGLIGPGTGPFLVPAYEQWAA